MILGIILPIIFNNSKAINMSFKAFMLTEGYSSYESIKDESPLAMYKKYALWDGGDEAWSWAEGEPQIMCIHGTNVNNRKW